jgi:Uri superfamily endonuclease
MIGSYVVIVSYQSLEFVAAMYKQFQMITAINCNGRYAFVGIAVSTFAKTVQRQQ